MRAIRPLILILAAALCFMAGYTVGKKHRYQDFSSPTPEVALATQAQENVSDAKPTKIAEPDAIAEAPEPPLPPTPDTALLTKRAQQRIVTLNDKQARAIDVEVIEVLEDSLKVRRQSDFRIVNVPVAMLSSEDQAFATYLWETQNPAPKDQTNTQKILDEIFGGF